MEGYSIETHFAMVIAICIMLMSLVLFVVSTLHKYFQRKAKIALYLFLHYVIYLFACIAWLIANWSAYEDHSAAQMIFSSLSDIGSGLIVIGSAILIYFLGELTKDFKMKWKSSGAIIGILIGIWIMLPFEDYQEEATGFQLKFISYLLMVVYCLPIYFFMGHIFWRTAGQIEEKKKEMRFISLGGYIFIISFFSIMFAGIFQNGTLSVISMIIMLISLTFLYLGFIIPARKSV
jgi:hypothetical protein